MNEFYAQHLQRIRAATVDRLKLSDLPKWVERETRINGRPFRFRDHEYQERIMGDDSREVVIRKCSQVGISEMSIRMALGLVSLMDAYSVIYTFPTATFASTYVKTRVDPVIEGSPFLRGAISNSVDSSEVKQVGHNFLYFKGAQAGTAAISVSCDHLIHDEVDFSDAMILGQYQSRLTHSPYKRKTKLSTPTVPDGPIDFAFKHSRRHWLFVKCHCCGHSFVPDYYEHVKIPGYDDLLVKITKDNLHKVRWEEAVLLCPHCGKAPSLQPEHREWVCENPSENYLAVGYQVSPFDAPNLITTPYLVEASTQYDRVVDFQNFNLGIPAQDAENGFTEEDLNSMRLPAASGGTTHVIGIDLGLMCHIMVGYLASDLTLVVVHRERVPLSKFRERYFALSALYRVTIKVSDIQPYTDLIMDLSMSDLNLFGASYVTRAGLDVYEVKQRETDPDNAIAGVRQVAINRNALFDKILAEARSGRIKVVEGQEWDLFKSHLTDMKRASATLRNGEFTSMWQKSAKGKDHYHHALGYLWVAAQMRGLASGALAHRASMVTKFRLKQKQHG